MWWVIGGIALLVLVAVLAARKNQGGRARGQRDHGDHADTHMYAHLHGQQTHTMGPF